MIQRFALALTVVVAVACGGGDAVEETKDWYSPWFIEEDPALPAAAMKPIHVEEIPADEIPEGAAGSPDLVGPAPIMGDMIDDPSDEPLAPAEARRVTIKVQRGETIRLYSKWSGVPEADLLRVNDLTKPRLRINQPFVLELEPKAYRRFEEARAEHFLEQEKAFFERYEVENLVEYAVKRGDSVWGIAKSHNEVPVWVLEKFNSNLNLARLRPGDTILIPVLKELAQNGDRAADKLWAKTPSGGGRNAANLEQEPVQPRRARQVQAPREELSRGLKVRVAKGESLGLYARWSGISLRDIAQANPQINPNRIVPGQEITVPMPEKRLASFLRKRKKFLGHDNAPAERSRERAAQAPAAPQGPAVRMVTHRVKPGETAWLIAVKRYNVTLHALKSANPSKDLSRLQAGDVLQVPVKRRAGGSASERTP